jgi:hypothetical protein
MGGTEKHTKQEWLNMSWSLGAAMFVATDTRRVYELQCRSKASNASMDGMHKVQL